MRVKSSKRSGFQTEQQRSPAEFSPGMVRYPMCEPDVGTASQAPDLCLSPRFTFSRDHVRMVGLPKSTYEIMALYSGL